MRSHYRYIIFSLFLPLLFLVLCIALPTTSYYFKISGYFWDPVVAQRFSLRQKKADLLFVGESSLVHGVQPIEVERVSGLSGLNLGIPVDALVLVPFMAIDRYLAHNAPPRMIVLNITPWSAAYNPGTLNCDLTFPWYSSAVMVLRYGTYKEAIDFFSSCPNRLFHLPLVIAKQMRSFDFRGGGYTRTTKILDDEDGYYPFDRNNPQIMKETRCEPYSVSPGFVAFVRELKRRYETNETRVIFYLNPTPALCSLDALQRAFAGLSDNIPYALDNNYFINYLHLGDRGALINSELLGTFLKAFK